MIDFEHQVHKRLRDISFVAARGNQLGQQNLLEEDRLLFSNLEAGLNIAQHHAYQYLKDLNDLISENQIGRLANHNKLEARDLSLIDMGYLIRRLFGSEANKRRVC